MTDQSEGGPKEVPPPGHVVQAKEIVRQTMQPSEQQQQVDIENLIELAEPLINAYFEHDAAKHERELTFDTKRLEYAAKNDRNLLLAVTFITAGVLVFCGYLIAKGQQEIAVDMIGRLLSIAGAALGAYGFAQVKRSREEREE